MSDRELLELAAKAAGIELIQMPPGVYRNATGAKPENNAFGLPTWNPLTDDGDALRLAVKLGMIVSIINHPDLSQVEVTAYPPDRRPEGRMAVESLGTDSFAATRRAIVRAAAEIGRNMT